MSAQHTPGRLEVTEGDKTHALLVARWSDVVKPGDAAGFADYRGIHVAELQHHSSDGAAPKAHAHQNARRMAACWNACEGLSTEALEQRGVIPVTALEEQRDELLAALRVARDVITTDRTAFADCNTGPDNTMEPDDAAALDEYDEALRQIDAAISKATGGKEAATTEWTCNARGHEECMHYGACFESGSCVRPAPSRSAS